MNMLMRKIGIFGLCIVTLASASYQFAAYSQERTPTVPRFWVVTSTEINASIGPLLDTYISDITPVLRRESPGVVVQKQALSIDPNLTPNQQVASTIVTLENAFREQGLMGAFIVGLPMPEVKMGDIQTHSTLPYGDFDDKYFLFSQHTNSFENNSTGTPNIAQSDIILGYLPDLGTNGFSSYFNAHHNYITQAVGYNRAMLYIDAINDTQLRDSLSDVLTSPVSGQAFDPNSYVSALESQKKTWNQALTGTQRWQPGLSTTSNEIMSYMDSWYSEPALATLRNLLPKVAKNFLDLPETLDTNILSEQENQMGTMLTTLGVFSTPIAIKNRFFSTTNLTPASNEVCAVTNPLPSPDSEEFAVFRNQFNALQGWIASVPRGSLLAQAPEGVNILLNGVAQGRYFIIRPGDFVSASSSEPVTLKTILIDPSTLVKNLEIPRTGFNNPGITDAEVPSWTVIDIPNTQINELIGWHYYLNTQDQYRYLVKNRLPPLNQYLSAPNTFEIVVNVLNQTFANSFGPNCLDTRNPSARSIVTVFSGYNAVDDNNLLLNELSTGKSLAIIATNSHTQSTKASFDYMPTAPFSGIAHPPLFTGFASGTMLGKSIRSGTNEMVNLYGDPCLTLPQ